MWFSSRKSPTTFVISGLFWRRWANAIILQLLISLISNTSIDRIFRRGYWLDGIIMACPCVRGWFCVFDSIFISKIFFLSILSLALALLWNYSATFAGWLVNPMRFYWFFWVHWRIYNIILKCISHFVDLG